jgi:hypothetical protein
MATDYLLKEKLKANLAKEQELEDELERNKEEKEKILKELLPFIDSDVYSSDYYMLKKDFDIDYSLEDPELQDYLRPSKIALDRGLLKKAIRAGIKFNNAKITEKLIAYKKKNELREIQRV